MPAADAEGVAGRLVLKTLERAGGVEPLSAWNSYSYGQGQSTGGKNPAGLSPLFGA